MIADQYPNATAHSRVNKLVVIGSGKRKVNKKEQLIVNFHHDDFDDNTVVYRVQRWVRVETEGSTKYYFESTATQLAAAPRLNAASLDTEEVEIEGTVFHAGNCAKDIAMIRNQGLMVDDDNEPAP